MKYIITDKGEVRTGGMFHADMVEKGEHVVSAGHFSIEGDEVKVWGKSIGFNINAKPKDAEAIKLALSKNK